MDRAAQEDTIVAVSTAPGVGAIGIVRISGPEATPMADRAFRSSTGKSAQAAEGFTLSYGQVVDPESGAVLDEALLAVMRAPRSYTREDVVEIQCHGGTAAAREIIRAIVSLGARIADPGEFTRRAFMNGRIDLTQAEGVASVVAARSKGALRASVRQLQGGLSDSLGAARRTLVKTLAWIEATVDFQEEELEEVDWGSVVTELLGVQEDLQRLLDTALLGRALDLGVRTAIVGRPNVGKSSLLNCLLARDRAIVSESPGTTRDTVEESVEMEGLPFCLVDTAGLRAGTGRVEELGVERARVAMAQADLVLAVVDLSVPWEQADQEIVRGLADGLLIVVGNKIDLLSDEAESLGVLEARVREALSEESVEDHGGQEGLRLCGVSALTGDGVGALRSAMVAAVAGERGVRLEEPILANERQRMLVGEALVSVRETLAGIEEGRGEELISEDLRTAVGALGRMTGEDLTDDVVDEIFGRFCIGK